MLLVRFFVIAVLLLAPLVPAAAQSVADVCDKAEYRIAMRDGVKLHTTVYTPKNAVAAPILIQRTPYSCALTAKADSRKVLKRAISAAMSMRVTFLSFRMSADAT